MVIFRYPGGKSRPYVQQQILRLLPNDFSEYREGFVGGGGVFGAYRRASSGGLTTLPQI